MENKIDEMTACFESMGIKFLTAYVKYYANRRFTITSDFHSNLYFRIVRNKRTMPQLPYCDIALIREVGE